MMANLVASLIAAEAITTTEAKAKALRPIAEKMITKARKGGMHNHRQVVSFLRDREMAAKLFDEIGVGTFAFDTCKKALATHLAKDFWVSLSSF